MSVYSHRIFLEVVEHASFVRAAESLNLTPPAISHAIAKMEREYGIPLFIRDRNGARLTGDGEKLLPFIRAIVQDEERLYQQVALIRGVETGNVSLATFNSVCTNWAPGIIGSFRKEHPQVTVNVCQSGYDGILAWLRCGYAEVGFLSETSARGDDIEFLPLYRDPIMCIAPKRFRPIHPGCVTAEDIANETVICQRAGYDADTNDLFNALGLNISRSYAVESDESIIALVESGLGVSFLPELVLQRLLHGAGVYPLDPPRHRTIGLATMRDRPLSVAAKALYTHIQLGFAGQAPAAAGIARGTAEGRQSEKSRESIG